MNGGAATGIVAVQWRPTGKNIDVATTVTPVLFNSDICHQASRVFFIDTKKHYKMVLYPNQIINIMFKVNIRYISRSRTCQNQQIVNVK